MPRPKALLCALLVVCTIAVGCGGSDSSSGDSKSGGQAPASSKPAAKPDVKVSMKNIQFKPMDITVKKGQTIGWTNDDSVTHNVTKEGGPGADFKSDNVNPGGTYQTTVDTPGKIDYVCTIHPNQRGTITVK